MTYDYRIKTNDFSNISSQLDTLSEKQLLKLAEVIDQIKQSDQETCRISTKNYFNHAILPILQDFAEITSSLLEVTEKQHQIIEATFKNTYGFDITESCKSVKLFFLLANQISISLEDSEIILCVTFDLKKLN